MAGVKVAVDLTGNRVRVLSGGSGSLAFAEAWAPPGCFVGGRPVDTGGLEDLLRGIFAELGVESGAALIAVHDENTTTRRLSTPLPAKHNAVVSELRRDLPVPTDATSIHWLDASARGTKSVFAVVSDSGVVRSLAQAVKGAGMTPLAVDLRSLCLARALGETEVAILDVAKGQGQIAFFEGGLPQLSHSFTRTRMAAAVRTAVQYYRRRYPESGIAKVVFTGDEPLERDTISVLHQEFGANVEPAARPSWVPQEVPLPDYLVCAGLMMRSN
jgi:hypothetical protein